MSGNKPSALVLCGDGINCERETAYALESVGFSVEKQHLNDLITDRVTLDQLCSQFQVLALPGGFSFGDDLTSGKVLALKITHRLKWDLSKYAERGGLVIGICNGFQALIKMQIFGREISITHNSGGKFLDTWVRVAPQPSRSVWLKGVGSMDLPIRHGEGRLTVPLNRKQEITGKMERQGMLCLKYEGDPNGSVDQLAGLCDPTGRILGLMPHPEAFIRYTSHPEWTAQPGRASAPGSGLAIFENAYKEAFNA